MRPREGDVGRRVLRVRGHAIRRRGVGISRVGVGVHRMGVGVSRVGVGVRREGREDAGGCGAVGVRGVGDVIGEDAAVGKASVPPWVTRVCGRREHGRVYPICRNRAWVDSVGVATRERAQARVGAINGGGGGGWEVGRGDDAWVAVVVAVGRDRVGYRDLDAGGGQGKGGGEGGVRKGLSTQGMDRSRHE